MARFEDGELLDYLGWIPSGAPPLLEVVHTRSWTLDVATFSERSEILARDLMGNIYAIEVGTD